MSKPKTGPTILQRRKAKQQAKRAKFDRQRALGEGGLANKYVLVNPANLAPDNSYGIPDYVARGYYVARPFTCQQCGVAQVWTETQQKWWYEVAKGNIWSLAILCRPCRKREQARSAAAREAHLAGVAAKRKKNEGSGAA